MVAFNRNPWPQSPESAMPQPLIDACADLPEEEQEKAYDKAVFQLLNYSASTDDPGKINTSWKAG